MPQCLGHYLCMSAHIYVHTYIHTHRPRVCYIGVNCLNPFVYVCVSQASEGVIVVAATNFPEVLDKALIRPGRFDRHVVVPNPDVEGRRQILEGVFQQIPKAPDVDLSVSGRDVCVCSK